MREGRRRATEDGEESGREKRLEFDSRSHEEQELYGSRLESELSKAGLIASEWREQENEHREGYGGKGGGEAEAAADRDVRFVR